MKRIVNGDASCDEDEYTQVGLYTGCETIFEDLTFNFIQSEFDISETEDDFRLDEFLNMNLTDFVKQTVEPVMSSFLAKVELNNQV